MQHIVFYCFYVFSQQEDQRIGMIAATLMYESLINLQGCGQIEHRSQS